MSEESDNFIDQLVDENVSFSTSSSPDFSCTVVTASDGTEQRILRWAQSRRKFNVSKTDVSAQEIRDLSRLYVRANGQYSGFKLRDWTDFSTADDHAGAPDGGDSEPQLVPGETDLYQMTKTYRDSGGYEYVRVITCIEPDTLIVWSNGDEVTPTDVDLVRGQFRASGGTITAGCKFYVPVRFGDDASQFLMSRQDFDVSTATLSLVEMKASELTESVSVGEAPDEPFSPLGAQTVELGNPTIWARFSAKFKCSTGWTDLTLIDTACAAMPGSVVPWTIAGGNPGPWVPAGTDTTGDETEWTYQIIVDTGVPCVGNGIPTNENNGSVDPGAYPDYPDILPPGAGCIDCSACEYTAETTATMNFHGTTNIYNGPITIVPSNPQGCSFNQYSGTFYSTHHLGGGSTTGPYAGETYNPYLLGFHYVGAYYEDGVWYVHTPDGNYTLPGNCDGASGTVPDVDGTASIEIVVER